MAKKYNYVFYLALLVAFGATFGVYQIMEANRRANQVATRPVVVANKNINIGELLEDDAFRVEHWPEPIVPDSAFADPTLIAGRVSGMPIFAGEVFVPGRLAPEGTAPGLEAKIPMGKRAVSIGVDDITGIAGHIQPGARVDVLLTLGGGSGQSQSKLFMPNMTILAMGEKVERNEKGEPIKTHTATIEVAPAEGERLIMASSQGRISLMLRGYTDNDTVKTKGSTAAEVAASLRDFVPPPPRTNRAPQQKAPVVEAPAAPTPLPAVTAQKPETLTIPVFRGRNKTEEKFKQDSVRKDSVRRDTIRP